MATATKTKSTKSRDEAPQSVGPPPRGYPDLNGLNESLQAERDLLSRCRDAAVSIALSKQSPTDPLTDEERAVLDRAGLQKETEIAIFVGRCLKARSLASEGGNPQQLAAAEAAIATAESAESSERPSLEKKIAELQSRLTVLFSAVNEARNNRDKMLHANEQLRQLCPPWCKSRYDESRRSINGKYAQRIGELESKIIIAETLKNLPHDAEQAVLHCNGLVGRDLNHPLRLVQRRDANGEPFGAAAPNPQAWREYTMRLASELPAVKEELAKLQGEKTAALEEAREPEYYFLRAFGLL